MSILAEALKKSRQDAGPTKPAFSTASVPQTPGTPPSQKISIWRIAFACASIAMVSYIGIVSLLGVQPSKNETTPRQTHVSAPLQVLSPKLEGIVWDAESPLAIVGGKPLKTGQSVDGWLIESIGMDRVRIARDGATQVLVLPATETKK